MATNTAPSGAQVTVTEAAGNTYKWLSGVPWLTIGNVMNISSTCNNVAMKSYKNTNVLAITWGDFGKAVSNYNATHIFNGIPNKASVADINTSSTPTTQFNIGNIAQTTDTAKVNVSYSDPEGATSAIDSAFAADKFRVDTYGDGASTSTLFENFTGEAGNRFTKTAVDANLQNKNVVIANADWNTATSIAATIGGELSLQVANKVLKYPNKDYTSTKPAGPNYAGLTGTRTYYRLFVGTGPFNGGRITFAGLANALSEIRGKSNIEVYLHLPGVATYQFGGGFENGNIFQDLGIYQNIAGGCGASTGGSGAYIDFSFGTTSSNASNYKCFMKIKVKNTNVSLQSINFAPTYA